MKDLFRAAIVAITLASFGAAGASATTITLSALSSDATPASVLDATFDFEVSGTSLTLTVTNDTTAPHEYNINQVFFNGSSSVAGLSLDSATHSVAGDVKADWAPVDTSISVDGFGTFDFGLTDGVGETHPAVIGPSEDVTFVLSISGSGPFDPSDFIVGNSFGLTAAGKFVNGPCCDDSAWGATPEPSTAPLVGSGLIALAISGRRRRIRAEHRK